MLERAPANGLAMTGNEIVIADRLHPAAARALQAWEPM